MSLVTVEGLAESDGVVFKALPAGRYPVRVVKIEEKETGPNSKNPGQPMLSMILRVTAQDEEYADEQLFYNSVYPNETMEARNRAMSVARIKQLIVASGLDIEGDSFDPMELAGCEMCAVVTQKVQDGKPTNNIQEFLSIEELD